MSSFDDPFPTQAVPIAAPPLPETAEAEPKVRSRRRGEARGLAWELVQTIALTLLIFVGVRAIVQNFRVEGASMEPTLETGQYLLINKAAYYHIEGTPLDGLIPTTTEGVVHYPFGGPKRGEVVVFRAPTQPDKDFIKRVIGLPGEAVLIRSGQVFINGQLLDEPYIHFKASYNYPLNGQPTKVPDNSYFVLGDNRPNSSDSHLGWFVPVDNLIGTAWVSYWPPADWGVMAHITYPPRQ